MKSFFATAITAVLLIDAKLGSAENSDCFACHSDNTLTKVKGGRQVSLYVDQKKYENSIHGQLECISCHADLTDAELPHQENLKLVGCGSCHSDVSQTYAKSLHGQAVKAGARLAPRCADCHGTHQITSVQAPNSPRSNFVVPGTLHLRFPGLVYQCCDDYSLR